MCVLLQSLHMMRNLIPHQCIIEQLFATSTHTGHNTQIKIKKRSSHNNPSIKISLVGDHTFIAFKVIKKSYLLR